MVTPYTQNFARKSGVKSPKKIAHQLIFPTIFFGRCASMAYTSNWCAAQLIGLHAPVLHLEERDVHSPDLRVAPGYSCGSVVLGDVTVGAAPGEHGPAPDEVPQRGQTPHP